MHLPCFFENLMRARIGVLYIIDGIVLRSLLCKIEVECHYGPRTVLQQEKSKCIFANLVKYLASRNESPTALGHRDVSSLLLDMHLPMNHDAKLFLGKLESMGNRSQLRNVPRVPFAKHIDN